MRRFAIVLVSLWVLGMAGVVDAEIVINEVDYDQSAQDTAEFIELYNNGAGPIGLGGFYVELVNGNGAVVYRSIALPPVELLAGDYYVICGNATGVPNCDEVLGVASDLIQNGAPDAVVLRDDIAIMDVVCYEGDIPGYVEGSGAGLIDGANAFSAIGRYPDGADTDQNNVDFTLQCATPGWSNSGTAADCVDPLPVETNNWGSVKAMYRTN